MSVSADSCSFSFALTPELTSLRCSLRSESLLTVGSLSRLRTLRLEIRVRDSNMADWLAGFRQLQTLPALESLQLHAQFEQVVPLWDPFLEMVKCVAGILVRIDVSPEFERDSQPAELVDQLLAALAGCTRLTDIALEDVPLSEPGLRALAAGAPALRCFRLRHLGDLQSFGEALKVMLCVLPPRVRQIRVEAAWLAQWIVSHSDRLVDVDDQRVLAHGCAAEYLKWFGRDESTAELRAALKSLTRVTLVDAADSRGLPHLDDAAQ